MEQEHRGATAEEQQVLSQYVGWGGLPDAFDPDKGNWAKEYSELKGLLSEDEYAAARSSVLNAHYTSPTVIRAIYDAVEKMGFRNGNILEPSMGIGNFFGMLPDTMQDSRLYGVESVSYTHLPKGEQNILKLIIARTLMAVSKPFRYLETLLTTECAGEEFTAKGKEILDEGWKAIERKVLADILNRKKEFAALPPVEESECGILNAELKEGQTSPPKHFTEDTLLHSMETASADSMPEDAERQGIGCLLYTSCFLRVRSKIFLRTRT